MSHAKPAPVGGKLLSPFFGLLLLLWALGSAAGLVRFVQGLGAATAMNDGYPWGIWIAIDVVVGTALGSGGFAVALLVYILNRGKYHPLVRPALLTSALGYTAGATAIAFDVGRYWNLWKVPFAFNGRYNWSSGLLEVALCVMAYTAVLWIEISPAFLERWKEQPGPLQGLAQKALPLLEKLFPLVLAFGVVLPAMHQSTLGSLFLVSVTKLHKLWHTPLLPALFLISCVGMGYGAVVVESVFSARAFKRPLETPMLADLAGIMAGITGLFLALRLVDVALRGRLGLALAFDFHALVFWAEVLLAAVATGMLWSSRGTRDAGALLRGAFALLAAGGLYRLDVYLTAFDPGNGWRYFPSVGEILVTLGIVAVETMVYIYVVRKFPILAGAPVPAGGRS